MSIQFDQTSPRAAESPASAGAAAKAVADDLRRLVRAELALAREEVGAAARERGIGIALFVGAGLLGLYAVFWMTFAIHAGWAALVPTWAAALLTVLVLGGLAAAMVLVGTRMLRAPAPTPDRAIGAARATLDRLRQFGR